MVYDHLRVGDNEAVKRRAAILAAVIVVVIGVSVPLFAWLASPSPLPHTVRSALCERGRPSPDGKFEVSVVVKEHVSVATVQRVVNRQGERCCPIPRAATSVQDARSKLQGVKTCHENVAVAIGYMDDTPGTAPAGSVRITLGPKATCDDQELVAAYFRRSGLAKSVYALCPES